MEPLGAARSPQGNLADEPAADGPCRVRRVPQVTDWLPDERGRGVLARVEDLVSHLGGELGRYAGSLLDRHGYRLGSSADGPHSNPLGHPLFELPIWLATSGALGRRIDEQALVDICEASLFGYLSVRAEDDYFDGAWEDPGAAMVLSGVFRARHHALLAPLVSDRRFWARYEHLWRGYGEAMLVERALHHPAARYDRDDFDLVLNRSQPLEIPGDAVLVMTGRWETVDRFARMVRHINTATQLFDDFVDAPDDLETGNLTWMVRRLGGLEGGRALRRGMISEWDLVLAEIRHELEAAVEIADHLGVVGVRRWVASRQSLMDRAAARMFGVLFGRGERGESAEIAR